MKAATINIHIKQCFYLNGRKGVCVCAKDTHKNLTDRAIECFHFCVCPVVWRNCAGSHDYNAIVVFFSRHQTTILLLLLLLWAELFLISSSPEITSSSSKLPELCLCVGNMTMKSLAKGRREDFVSSYLFKNGQRRRRENQVSLNSHLVERESLG